MKETIQQEGVITNIKPGEITVSIEQKSACTGCHAASYCVSTDCKDRAVKIKSFNNKDYSLGERVLVIGSRSMGHKAVLLSFVLPLVLLLVVAVLCISVFHTSEVLGAGISLASVVLYYLFLSLFEKRLSRDMIFMIKKISITTN